MNLTDFYRVIRDISRIFPNEGWHLCLLDLVVFLTLAFIHIF